MSILFIIIAIVISALGLFGLISFTTEQRAKEIGIRKVMGASVSTVVLILCRDFVWLAALAIAIGAPISYYYMDKFLDQYAFQIGISPWLFVITSVAMLTFTLAIVAFKALRAAQSNPVQVIRLQ